MKSEKIIREEQNKIKKIIKDNQDVVNIGEAVAQVEMLKWVLGE